MNDRLITVLKHGTKVPMKIMKTFDVSPIPNHSKEIDTQAMGGIGLKISKTGFTKALVEDTDHRGMVDQGRGARLPVEFRGELVVLA